MDLSAATLGGCGTFAFVDEVALQQLEQKGAECPAVMSDSRQGIFSDQLGKKTLGEVLGIPFQVTPPARVSQHVSTDRPPIRPTELFPSLSRLWRTLLASRQHGRPVRGGEHCASPKPGFR